jgi:hypothetical protein
MTRTGTLALKSYGGNALLLPEVGLVSCSHAEII